MIHKAKKRLLATTLLAFLCFSEIGNAYVFAGQKEETPAVPESVMEETDAAKEEVLEAQAENEDPIIESEEETQETSVEKLITQETDPETETVIESETELVTETAAETSVYETEITETETEETLQTEEEITEEEISETEVPETEIPETEIPETEIPETEETVKEIIGFVKNGQLFSIDISDSARPDEARLISKMPASLKAAIRGENGYTEIPVTWRDASGEYTSGHGYYYQFVPVFEEGYALKSSLSEIGDVPYVSVFVNAFTASASGRTSFSAAERDKNAQTIYDFLLGNMGYNSAAACGVLGNIYHESCFNPDLDGDYGTSYGICQWHNSRKTALINYCQSNGYDYRSLIGQLYYLQYELTRYYRSVNNHLLGVENSANGAYDAGYYWCYYFEMPSNTAERSVVRGNLARDTYWPKYGKTPASSIIDKDDDNETTTEVHTTQAADELVKLATPVISSVVNKKSGICISFKKVSKANAYEIYRKTGSGSYVKIGQTTSTVYTDGSVKAGTSYSYKVKAVMTDDPAGLESCRVIAEPSLNYRKGPGTSYSVSGSLRYNSKVKRVSGYQTSADGYTWSKIYINGSYYYVCSRFLAKDNSTSLDITGESEQSKAAEIIRLESPELTLKNTEDGIVLSYSTVTGADSYVIYRKESGSDYSIIKITKNSSFTDKKVKSGKTYTYKVEPANGDVAGSVVTDKHEYLKRPVASAVKNGTSIKVSWKSVEGAESYMVYRKAAGGAYQKIATVTGLSYTDSSVKAGTVYSYKIHAHADHTSYGSKPVSCTVKKASDDDKDDEPSNDGTKPAKVKNLVGKADGSKAVLTWDQVSGADGYIVYRKTSGSYKEIARTANCSYNDTDVSEGSTYTYKVAAYKEGASSGTLYEVSALASTLRYRSGPGLKYATVGALASGSRVNVVAGYSKNADGYTWVKIKVNGKVYYAVERFLKAVSGSSETLIGPSSSGVSVKIKAASSDQLAAPKITSIRNVSSGIELKWNSVRGADGYVIYRKVSGQSEYTQIDTTDALSYVDTDVRSGLTYSYKVAAYTGSSMDVYQVNVTSNLRYRNGPGLSYDTVGALSPSGKVNVISGYTKTADGYNWVKIKVGSSYYYACGNFLKLVSRACVEKTGSRSDAAKITR